MRVKSVGQWQLRASFAQRLSDMYGREVPAYTTLVDVSREVNDDVAAPARAPTPNAWARIDRVTAERHGAIRVGTPARAAAGRADLRRDGHAPGRLLRPARGRDRAPCPSSRRRSGRSTAEELARNPFRVFTSMLTTADRRFFDADLRRRLETLPRLPRTLPARAARPRRPGRAASAGCPATDAERFLAPGDRGPSSCRASPSTRPGTRRWSGSPRSPRTSAACAARTSTTSRRGSSTSTSSTGG